MVQRPILGIWCCEGDLLDAKRIWVAQVIPMKIPMLGEGNPLKRGPRLWLGASLATNQSEAFVRTATMTKMTAEVVPRTRTVWKGTEAEMLGEVHEAMTNVDEGMSIRWRDDSMGGEGWRRSTAMQRESIKLLFQS